MKPRSASLLLVGTLLPLAVWLSALSLLYGIATLECARTISYAANVYGQLAIGVLAAAMLVIVLGLGQRLENRFFRQVSLGVSVLAMQATLWLLVPFFMLGRCE